MHLDFQASELVCVFDSRERSIARVNGKRHSECCIQSSLISRNIGKQKTVGFNQNRFAFGVGLRQHSRTGQQTIRKRFRDKLRLGCALLCKELRVLGNQLNLIAYFLKFNQPGTAHLAAIQTALTH